MAHDPLVVGQIANWMNNPSGDPGVPPTVGVGAAGAAAAGGPVVPVKPAPVLMKINDTRRINPGTGQPFSQNTIGAKSTNADVAVLKAIIAHAKAHGQDPYTNLAIGMQESDFGRKNPDFGMATAYDPDKRIPLTDRVNIGASKLAMAMKEKLAYAAQLQKSGKIKPGEDYALQAYNGYGDLRSRLMKEGNDNKYVPQRWYGNMITGDTPFLMSEHPLYGRTIISLRDEILKKHPDVKKLVDTTPAWVPPSSSTVQ